MNKLLFILVFYPFVSYSQDDKIGGRYCYRLDFDHTPIYRDYTLELHSDSTFNLYKLSYEVCYSTKDTLVGFWNIKEDLIYLEFFGVSEKKSAHYKNEDWIFKPTAEGNLASSNKLGELGTHNKKVFVKNCP